MREVHAGEGPRRLPRRDTGGGWTVAGLLLTAAWVFGAPAAAAQTAAQGKAVYDRWCAECHGAEGAGDGPAAAYMLPRPRDFTRALYQIKTTPAGALPADEDILRIIDEGMPGTAMPGWRSRLTNAERRALVQHLRELSPFFASEPPAAPLTVGRAPRADAASLEEGRAAYELLECWRCHGQQGRGDGPSAHEQTDNDGFPIRPADLTQAWRFTGGSRVEDIYLRLMTGLDGTPMPSQADAVSSGVVTEEQLWHLANYVRSLSPAQPPRVRDVARAPLIDELPTTADDPVWAEVDEFFFPLAGQIIVPPRWFAPTVNGVWLRALHDGEELVLRLRWHDPSRSPEERWQQWQALVLSTMEPNEGGPTEPQVLPDAFAVQFPRTIPTGMDRPHFLMGSARDPVYVWYWSSDAQAPSERLARSIGNLEILPPNEPELVGEATWEEGEWVLLLRRALDAGDDADRLSFATGTAIPIGFFAWDGDNSEAATRGAISTWYHLYLDEPTSNLIYLYPVTTTVLTFALGLFMVVRAQRRPRVRGESIDHSQHQGSP